MRLKASEWKGFVESFPRDMINQCENHWDEYQPKLAQLADMTPDLFDLDIDVELEAGITPEIYRKQCFKEASQFSSQAAWSVHFNGRRDKFDEAKSYIASAFALAHHLTPNSPDWHEAVAEAKYARGSVWRGNSRLVPSFELAREVFEHMQAISDRIHPETWVHVYNQMALGLRYVDGRLEEACTYIEEAERVLATMEEPLVLTQAININMFLRAIELSAAARHTMNKGAIYKKAGRDVTITDAEALKDLPQTPLYVAYMKTSLATEYMAENRYTEAHDLAYAAYSIYLSLGNALTENALATLLTLIEAQVALKQDARTPYVTAQNICAGLQLDTSHDFSKRMLKLEPQMAAIIEQGRTEAATSPVRVGSLSLTVELAKDNEAERERQEQEIKAAQDTVTSTNV
jgi:hypothetical protein